MYTQPLKIVSILNMNILSKRSLYFGTTYHSADWPGLSSSSNMIPGMSIKQLHSIFLAGRVVSSAEKKSTKYRALVEQPAAFVRVGNTLLDANVIIVKYSYWYSNELCIYVGRGTTSEPQQNFFQPSSYCSCTHIDDPSNELKSLAHPARPRETALLET